MLEQILKRADIDNDGALDIHEFKRLLLSKTLNN